MAEADMTEIAQAATSFEGHVRRWPRHRIDVPIRVIVHRSSVHTSSKTSIFPARGNELSEGGIALTAGVELKPGDETEVEFTPPYSGSPIRVRGIVRNRTGYRYGIEFLAGDHQEAQQVDHLRSMLSILSPA